MAKRIFKGLIASWTILWTVSCAFAAQGTHPLDFLNSTLVSAELVKTLVGSFGLVLVAPFTAVVSSFMLKAGNRRRDGDGVRASR